MSHSPKTTTSARFRLLTGTNIPTPIAASPAGNPILPEVEREQQLSVRLKGPEATCELIAYIGDLKTIPGRTLLMSGGGGAFAAQFAEALHNGITVLHSDPLVVEALKARVLGSEAAVVSHLAKADREPRILWEHIIRPGIEYHCVELPKAPFADETFSLVVIEQGHAFGLQKALSEASRLLCDGGAVVLLGYMPMFVVSRQKPAKDAKIAEFINERLDLGFDEAFLPFVSSDERALLETYSQAVSPFVDLALPLINGDYRSRMFMRAAWDLHTLRDHMRTWPVTRRLEESGSISNLDWWGFMSGLSQMWGSSRTRRVLNWPVALRFGVKTSGAQAKHAWNWAPELISV